MPKGQGKPLSVEHRAKISKALRGRRLSPERCREMSESTRRQMQSAEARKRISDALRGKRNALGAVRTAEERALLSKMMLGRKNALGCRHSDQARTACSERALARFASNERFHVKGYFESAKAGGPIPYRSVSVELRIMEILEASDNVLSWEYEYAIRYRTEHGIRHTVPDFLVRCRDGRWICIEGKGKHLVEKYLASEKYAITTAWCEAHGYEFMLVTEKDLKDGWGVR